LASTYSIHDAALTADDAQSLPFGAFAPSATQALVLRLAHASGLKRGAFRPMLSRVLNLLRPGPLDVSFQGADFRLYHQASATERGALLNPDYDRAELDFLRRHTPVGGVVIDIGANVGTYALTLARHVGPRGTVIAVEPHPVTHARLSFNRAASGLGHVRLVAAAAGDVDGEVTIETDLENLGASHIVTSAAGGEAFKVPSMRLQTILERVGAKNVDALKIDIEGFEDRVLSKFFHDAPVALWPRAVVIEHLARDDWGRDCIAEMIARGYKETGWTRSNTLLLRN